jgi:hypothetical protein
MVEDKYGHHWVSAEEDDTGEPQRRVCSECACGYGSSDAKIACLALWAPED